MRSLSDSADTVQYFLTRLQTCFTSPTKILSPLERTLLCPRPLENICPINWALVPNQRSIQLSPN